MTHKVSVIVPSFNQGRFLGESLDSVLAQTFGDWECIVINDGSTDDTEEVAYKYVHSDQRFKYISQKNQGVVAARNNAIRNSMGKYILPLDGDDKISSTYLEKAVPVLDKDDSIKIVYGNVEYFGITSGKMELMPYSMATLLVTNCFTNSSLFRRSDFDRTGGYNSNMGGGLEDWDFWISVLENGGSVYKINDVCLYYRILPNSRNKIDSIDAQSLRNNIWKNHLGLYQKEFQNLWMMHQDITNSRLYPFFEVIRRFRKKFRNE